MKHSGLLLLASTYVAPLEVWLFMATVLVAWGSWAGLMWYLFHYLKREYPEEWKYFGRPEVPSSNLLRYCSALIYLATARHRALNDPFFSRYVIVMRLYTVFIGLDTWLLGEAMEPYRHVAA